MSLAHLTIVLTLAGVSLSAFSGQVSDPRYSGSKSCAECHQAEYQAWQGSHHDLAMQPADEQTVLGDFDDAEFSYGGVTSRFFRRDGRFMVRTDGPDGELRDYQIAYTFGVLPLQQYLIEFPGGRLQSLGIAWDSHPKESGGQRWFHLYPDQQVDHTHPLHWTSLDQTWNHQCAECHSTELKKNYEANSNTYKTAWVEIDVACESCHGPGARHLAWANKEPDWEQWPEMGLAVALDERKGVTWAIDAESGNAARSTPLKSSREIELCARCHSRRSLLSEDYVHGKRLLNTHMPALLSDGLYHADGQIDDEVYVYGSFLQSKMYQAGVTCSDCHEPHTLKLRSEGNGVCLQCHGAYKFDTPKHHFHEAGTEGASCAECHMPPKSYMVVDPRHDHSMRIPRPDLSVSLGTPNACNDCHKEQPPQWAADQVKEWYKEPATGYQQYAEILHQGRRDGPGAASGLNRLALDAGQPPLARATALSLLPGYLDRTALVTLAKTIDSEEPLIRLAAVGALESIPANLKLPLAGPLLGDEQLAVRIEAARVLADIPLDQLGQEPRAELEKALSEYEAAQQLNADRPDALVNLGNLHLRRGDPVKAETFFKQAMKLQPGFSPAYVNLADLYRGMQRDREGEALLRQAIVLAPGEAGPHHALGLLLVRAGKLDAALAELEQAARLNPDNPRYSYVYAVALNSVGKHSEAIAALEQAVRRHPTHRDTLYTLVDFNTAAGDRARAGLFARRFRQLWPEDPRSRSLSGGGH